MSTLSLLRSDAAETFDDIIDIMSPGAPASPDDPAAAAADDPDPITAAAAAATATAAADDEFDSDLSDLAEALFSSV